MSSILLNNYRTYSGQLLNNYRTSIEPYPFLRYAISLSKVWEWYDWIPALYDVSSYCGQMVVEMLQTSEKNPKSLWNEIK